MPRSPPYTRRRARKANISEDDEDSEENSDHDSYSHSDKSYTPNSSRNRSKISIPDSPGYGSSSPSLNDSRLSNNSLYPNLGVEKEKPSPDSKFEHKKLYPNLKFESKAFESPERLSKQEVQESIDKQPPDSPSSYSFIVVALILLLVVVYALIANPSSQGEGEKGVSPFVKFVSDIDHLQKYFPNQETRLWKTIKASTKHVLNEAEPDYPVVILMASKSQHAAISTCIARKITSTFESALGFSPAKTKSDISSYRHLIPSGQKKRLDNDLQSAFATYSRRAVVIENLQSLAAEAALLLHGYCDNDNAPFKDVMIVLTLHIPPEEPGINTADGVENYLIKLWNQDLDMDKVGALMTRVANNIVIVGGEEEASLKEICS